MFNAPTQINSGSFPAGSNTPTGAPLQIPIDSPYLTIDDFILTSEAQGLGITSLSPAYSNGELANKILQASAWVNRTCRKYFDTQTVDYQNTRFQVRPYNPQLVTVVLPNRPYQHINSIYIQVLKWFIQVDVSATGYLQDFPQQGYYKIVPLLSSAGTGLGSPIPAAILDRVPLGVLWTNYTFGYGQNIVNQGLDNADAGVYEKYQAPVSNRLWSKAMPVSVFKNSILQTAGYTVTDYINGIITFTTPNLSNDVITASFTTNQSVPADIIEATLLYTLHLIGQSVQNPLGAASYGIQTYNISFSKELNPEQRALALLTPYISVMPTVI